jgi:hypothetical protein
MANYLPSNLAKAQARLLNAFATADKRFRDPVVHKMFLMNAEIMFPSYQQLRTREDRTVEANYFVKTDRALGTGRSHNHTGAKGDTSILTPSWTTYNDVFAISLKQGDNNVRSYEEMMMNEMENCVRNFMIGLETVATGYAFNNRSQVSAATAEVTFNGVTFVHEIATGDSDRSLQIATTSMDVNAYQGLRYHVVADSIMWNKLNFQFYQGSANSTNLSFQFGGVEIMHAPELTTLASVLGYTDGFMLLIPEGHIGGLPWIPIQNRQGVSTKENEYGTILNPFDGLNYAIHSYVERADDSATNGYTQDILTEFECSLDMAYEHAPLSTANETPIQAFAIV